jgi:hypothetical protein
MVGVKLYKFLYYKWPSFLRAILDQKGELWLKHGFGIEQDIPEGK